MVKAKNLIVVGIIKGAHGVRGDVRIKSLTEKPETLFSFGPLLFETSKTGLIPKSFRAAKDHFIVRPNTARQKEEWDALKGTKLYVPRDKLPPTETDAFYIEDMIGLEVFDAESDTHIGRVKAVLNHGAGDILDIQLFKPGAKSILVPFTPVDVPDIDLESGQLTLADHTLWGE